MKSALQKNTFIEIFKTKSRFISIFAIVAIGIAFFAGVNNTAPDMKNSADSYYKKYNLPHYRLISTLGFTEEDIAVLNDIDGVTVYPGYFTDVLVKNGENDEIVRVMSLSEYGKNNEVNQLELIEGRFPEKSDECLADSGGLATERHPGDKITILSGDRNDIKETVSVTEYTVVGTFVSPSYIDMSSRGNTTIGNGSISSLMYIPEENFNVEVYTELYLTSDSLATLKAYSTEYDKENERITELLEAVGENREIERYDEILSEANEEIEKAEKELDEAKENAEKELSDAKTELDNALKEIEDGEAELVEAKNKLDEAKQTLNESRKTLDENKALYESSLDEFNDKISKAKFQLSEQRKQLDENYSEYLRQAEDYNQNVRRLKSADEEYQANLDDYNNTYEYYTLLDNYYRGYIDVFDLAEALGRELPGIEYRDYINGSTDDSIVGITVLIPGEVINAINEFTDSLPTFKEINEGFSNLSVVKTQLDAAKEELDKTNAELKIARDQINAAGQTFKESYAQLDEAEKNLENEETSGQNALDENKLQLDNAEQEYQKGIDDYRQGEIDYAEGLAELQEGRDKYNDGLKEYENGRNKANSEIADGEQKIRDAKRELLELENPTWYVFDRDNNPGYAEYGQNAERINNIAAVFPIFFILVAALVCLTTMTRMVEEQRLQIGTLKALGYTNGQIIYKYMFYALSATVLGGLFGAVIGQKLFPFVIMTAYGMLYTMSEIIIPTDWVLTFLCVSVSVLAVSLTVYFSCKSELSEQPAQLMRPKAPRAGKKILLDKLSVWKKVGFNGKVTARNLFRYKRRMLMTVVGIAGCTALTLVGFALEDSISDIINKQYEELVLYDGFFAYDSVDDGDTVQILNVTEKNNCDTVKYLQKKLNVSLNGKTVDAYLTVPENKDDFIKLFLFRDRKTGESFEFYDDRVIIDEKLSILLGAKAGDVINIYREGEEKHSVEVSACTENYPNHYVYMSQELYADIFGEKPDYNIMAFKERNGDILTEKTEQERFSAELLATNAVLSVSFKDNLVKNMSSMLNALNSVVWVLIISAGTLAFVVLYNLTNINITERMREIATLKVMGFYDSEVDSYIFRETFILTLMGIAVGLFGGYFLSQFIIQTAEIDMVMFGREVSVMSYVLSALITIVFSVIVMLYMHGHLKKVDMIEALKSVE